MNEPENIPEQPVSITVDGSDDSFGSDPIGSTQDDGGSAYRMSDIKLRLDHKNGVMMFGPSELPADAEFLLLGFTPYRELFGAKYSQKMKHPVVCSSLNGTEGYGLGRMFSGDEAFDKTLAWAKKLKKRDCCTPDGSPICKAASSPQGAEWVCRPNIRVMGLMKSSKHPWWVPYFFDMKGTLKSRGDEWRRRVTAACQLNKVLKGDRYVASPRARFSTKFIVTKDPNLNYAELKLGDQITLSDEEVLDVTREYLLPGGQKGSGASEGKPSIMNTLWTVSESRHKKWQEEIGIPRDERKFNKASPEASKAAKAVHDEKVDESESISF